MSGFVLALSRPGETPAWLLALRLGPGPGWAHQMIADGVDVFVQPGPAQCAVFVQGPDLLFGEIRVGGSDLPDSLFDHTWESPLPQARSMMRRAWGGYVHVRLADQARPLSIFRSPSGDMAAVTWRRDAVDLVASTLPDWLTPALPEDLAIDWRQVAGVLSNPTQHTAAVCLRGLQSISPGGLWAEGVHHQVWTPTEFIEKDRPRGVDWAPELLATVDQVVRVSSHSRALIEISGGLDSTIVVGALAACGGEITCGLNYYGGERQGDERPYARAVAHRWGLDLTEVQKPLQPLDLDALAELSSDLRPALNSFDHVHDDHVAAVCQAYDVEVILTGQGGDNVFFQTPTPLIAADHLGRVSVSELLNLARWQGRSIWGLVGEASRARWGGPTAVRAPPFLTARAHELAVQAPVHPWLCDLEHVGPAKYLQIASLANALIVHGRSRRGQAARLRHPLLAQPLVELCLAIPAVDLTLGGIDRGLARQVFAHRIPEQVARRRTKGRLSAHYGQTIALSLPDIVPLLLEGRLAAMGLLQAEPLKDRLSVEHLIWHGGYGDIVNLIMTELWVRAWERRMASS